MGESFEQMRIQLSQTYSQNDPRWRKTMLGSSGTIGEYGCLLSDAAMVCTYFGHEVTPDTLNSLLKRNNGYVNGNLFVWDAISRFFPDIIYQGQIKTPDALTTAQMNAIRDAINKGFPVFLQIDTIPNTSGLDEHWILAVDYDGDDFIVQDPWDGSTKRISSWGVRPQELIYAYAYYSGTPLITLVNPSNPSGNSTGGITIDKSTFEHLVQKSSQWDIVADKLAIDKNDAGGGSKVSQAIELLQRAPQVGQPDPAIIANLQANYSALQTQFGMLQQQYQSLLQAKNADDSTTSMEEDAWKRQYQDAQTIITSLEKRIEELESGVKKPVVEDSSTKSFWESKKVIVASLTTIIPAALVVLQSVQVKPGDSWEEIASKFIGAAVTALGISTVGNQYLKAQGEVDSTALKNKI